MKKSVYKSYEELPLFLNATSSRRRNSSSPDGSPTLGWCRYNLCDYSGRINKEMRYWNTPQIRIFADEAATD